MFLICHIILMFELGTPFVCLQSSHALLLLLMVESIQHDYEQLAH